MGVCNCSMFYSTLLYDHSSIAIILMGKRELIALLNLSSWCLMMVERLFLAVPRGCLQFVIVVFPDHTHLLFFTLYIHDSFTVAPYAVEYIVSYLQLRKAAGPKIIYNIFLKELKDVLSAPLCDRFNAFLSQDKVQSIWKEANVTLIHKNMIIKYC